MVDLLPWASRRIIDGLRQLVDRFGHGQVEHLPLRVES